MDRKFDTRQLLDLPPTADQDTGLPAVALDPAIAEQFGDFMLRVYLRTDLDPEPDSIELSGL